MFRSYAHLLQLWPERGTFHVSAWAQSWHYPPEQCSPAELSVMMETFPTCAVQYSRYWTPGPLLSTRNVANATELLILFNQFKCKWSHVADS